MPKRNRSAIVDVHLNKSGTRSFSGAVDTVFKPPIVPQHASFSFTADKRIRSNLITTVVGAKGWRPPTAYRSAAVRRRGEYFFLRNTNPASSVLTIEGDSRPISGTTYGYAPGDSLFFDGFGIPTVSTNTVARAETEVLNKLREAAVDLGGNLAELRTTLEDIASLASFLYYILVEARKGNWNAIGRMLKIHANPRTVAEAWLAYCFGIMPVVSDISTAINTFNKGLREKDALIHVSRTVRNDVTPLFIATGNWTKASQSGRVEELAKAVIYAKISDSTLANLSSWGAINPAAAIWEGLGWSFLVDWLLPIGNFLNAMSSTVGLTFQGGSLTTRIHANLKYEVWPDVSGTVLVGVPCRTSYQCLATQRTVYLTWPTPWPYIKNPLSTQHVSIAASLIVTGLKDPRFRKTRWVLVGNYSGE